MNHVPLFAGINGFGLAAEWLGWNQPFHCEIDEVCQTVIKYYWPNSKPYYDITKTDFSFWRGKVDILSGGFPCQPFSNAGNKKGVDDGRYLWPEYLRAIREIKPPAVVGENVTGLLTMEQHEMFARVDSRRVVRFENYDEYEGIYTRQATLLVNDICEDLEKEGYDVQTFVIPAAGVGAPHRRDRIWFVAHTKSGGGAGRLRNSKKKTRTQKSHDLSGSECRAPNKQRASSNSDGSATGNKSGKNIGKKEKVWGNQKSNVPRELSGNGNAADTTKRIREKSFKWINSGMGRFGEQIQRNNFRDFPTQSPICSGNDGLPSELDGITFSKWRNESIKAYGNAIVPQVAYEIFKALDFE